MSRPKTYTDRLPKTVCDDINALFGKPRNAYDRLCIGETSIPFSRFLPMIRWGPCTPTEREIVESRWLEWRSGYLSSPFAYDDFRWRPAFEALVHHAHDDE